MEVELEGCDNIRTSLMAQPTYWSRSILTINNTFWVKSKSKQPNSTGGSSDVVSLRSSCSSKTTWLQEGITVDYETPNTLLKNTGLTKITKIRGKIIEANEGLKNTHDNIPVVG